MRIALITDGIWPYVVGGMQKHSYHLCKYLAGNDINVDLYYTQKGSEDDKRKEDFFTEKELKNIQFILVEFNSLFYFPGHYLIEKYNYSRNIFTKIKFGAVRYDLIYIQGLAGWNYLLNRHKLSSNAPVVLNFHGLNMFQSVKNLRSRVEQIAFKSIARKMLNKADYVQSLGANLTKLLIKEGIEESKIFEAGIGIEENWITNLTSVNSVPRTFTFIGRYDRIKGIAELNEVLKKLIPKYDFKFSFIGSIPEQCRIRDQKINYLGVKVNQHEIMSELDATDFLVLPSYSEGMPTVILEAMARKCAIIATDVGAVPMQVSTANGILIQASNLDDLFNAMERGIQMSDVELLQMKEESYSKVTKHFIWHKTIDKMIVFFKEISAFREN